MHIACCAAVRDARSAMRISPCVAGLFVCAQIDHPAATGLPLHSVADESDLCRCTSSERWFQRAPKGLVPPVETQATQQRRARNKSRTRKVQRVTDRMPRRCACSEQAFDVFVIRSAYVVWFVLQATVCCRCTCGRAGPFQPPAKGVRAAKRRETGHYDASRRGYLSECSGGGLLAWFATA